MLRPVVLLGFLLIASWTDLRTRRIPNVLTLFMTVGGLLMATFQGKPAILSSACGVFLGVGLLQAARYVSGGGVGGGDVKLVGGTGCYLGPLLLLRAVFWASVLLSLAALLLSRRRHMGLREPWPFAPFLLSGVILTFALE